MLSSAFFQVLSNSVRLPEPLPPAPKFRKRFLFIASGQFFSRFQAILKCRGAKTLRWWCAKCLSFKTLFFTWVIFYSVFLRKFWLFLVDFFRYFPTPHYSPSSEHFRKGRANDFFRSVYPRSVQAQEIEGLRTACLEWRVERVGFADRVRPVFPTQFFYDRYFAKTVCYFLTGFFLDFFKLIVASRVGARRASFCDRGTGNGVRGGAEWSELVLLIAERGKFRFFCKILKFYNLSCFSNSIFWRSFLCESLHFSNWLFFRFLPTHRRFPSRSEARKLLWSRDGEWRPWRSGVERTGNADRGAVKVPFFL